jgi:DNA-directed RNA polymerase specialized sigma24 family protein
VSSNWLAHHAQLVRSVNRHSNIALFPKLFPKGTEVRSFRDPTQLLNWLHGRGGDPEQRNILLRTLHFAAVGDAELRRLAIELLILALWPGLCVARSRLRSFRELDQLETDLLSGLTEGILKSDPGKVTRVAATLLRNLRRDLLRTYRRDAQMVLSDHCDVMDEKTFAELREDRPEDIIKAAQRQLGDDGLMLALVHIGGVSQKDAARLLGITHDAARKRCQRAFARLKKNFDG